MAWTVLFNQDTEAVGLGTVTAKLTDDNSGQTICDYARQVKTMSAEDCDAFAAEAKNYAASIQEKTASTKAASDKITAGILASLNK